MVAIVRGGGHIECFASLYRSESPTQVATIALRFLIETLGEIEPDKGKEIFFGYDNMCNLGKGCLPKKNSKIWDIGPKGGRGSSLNPKFFSYFNWDKYCRREGVKRSLSQNNTINFCSPYSSFMDFRII